MIHSVCIMGDNTPKEVNNEVNEHWSNKIKKTETCWYYTGAKKSGYGWVYNPDGTQMAHRLAYMAANGPIPPNQDIDHTCFVKACVNPAHLEAVSRGENTRRSNIHYRSIRMACRKGHARTEANSRPRPDGRGTVCRICHRTYMRRYSRRS